MSRISNENVEQSLAWRYATKQFDPAGKIPARDWQTLEQSLIQAPSSFGLQPWRFVVVEDVELRAQLQAHSWNQSQVTQASHFVVLAAKRSVNAADVDKLINQTASSRGVPPEKFAQYRSMILGFIASPTLAVEHWTTRQVYLALGMLLSTASLLKIDACPLEGIDPAQYDKLLDLEGSEYSAKVACALGYRSADDTYASASKIRYDAADMIVRK